MAPHRKSSGTRWSLGRFLGNGASDLQAQLDGLLQRAARANPPEGALCNEIGDTYLELEDVEKALAWYRRAVTAFDADHMYPRAAALCRKIIRLRPGDLSAHELLARIYVHEGRLRDACAQLIHVAEAEVVRHNIDRALELYDAVCRLDPSRLKPHHRRIHLARLAGSPGRAATYALEAARELHRQGSLDEALDLCQQARRDAPDRADIPTFEAHVLLDADQAAAARSLLAPLIEEEGVENHEMSLLLARAYERLGLPLAARQTIEKALEKSPENLHLRRHLIDALHRAGESDRAAQLIGETLPLAMDQGDLLLARDLALSASKINALPTPLLARLIQALRPHHWGPETAPLLADLAAAYEQQGRLREAIDTLEDASDLAEDPTHIRQRLAAIEERFAREAATAIAKLDDPPPPPDPEPPPADQDQTPTGPLLDDIEVIELENFDSYHDDAPTAEPIPRTSFPPQGDMPFTAAAAERLYRLAAIDPLTGFYREEVMRRRIDEEFRRVQRYAVEVALLWIELAGLERVRHALGHDRAEMALLQAAEALEHHTRTSDLWARTTDPAGFLCLLPLTDEEGARRTAHKLREVAREVLHFPGIPDLTISLACGIASSSEGTFASAHAMIEAARERARSMLDRHESLHTS